MKENIINIESIHQCNCCLGNKTLHPLVSVIDLSKANLEQPAIQFEFYTILLLDGQTEEAAFGRKYYDYSSASLAFLLPGESIDIEDSKILFSRGRLLAFHPDLLCHTSLGKHIKEYTFFFYKQEEALHLSLREKTKVQECLYHIGEELQHAVDCHSKTLITRYIQLLLDYCTRYYERQFITRCEANRVILQQMNLLLDDYIRSGRLKSGIEPSTEYCAEKLRLSPPYLNDLLKFETGKNTEEYFQQKRLDASKKMLLNPHNTVSLVAEELGFSNVQYFSRLFKKLTGIAPQGYRLTQN